MAFIIVSKFADHLPLYRLEKILGERYKVPIRRQRMCDWIGYVVDNWLNLIYHSIRQGLFKSDYLQIDGYIVYDSVTRDTDIIQLGCWAHARRKFFKAFQEEQLEAARYLLLIRRLYKIETSLPQEPEEILATRHQQSRPILDDIHKQLQEDRQIIRANTSLAEAINYTLSQWGKLTAYLEHPQTRIDNNLTEQSIRPCKLGAKNWLFIGHPGAGHRSAVIYTLIESCRRHGIEPQAYLCNVLKKLPSMTNHQAANLTPDKWIDQDI